MGKILSWIKKNILGLEPPKRPKKKTSKAAAKKVSKFPKKPLSKAPVKKNKAPVKKVKISPAAKKEFKQNSSDLLKVSKQYLKKSPTPKVPAKPEPGKLVGVITHFFPNVSAAIIKVKGAISVGDKLHFKGPVTDFKITVKSMQMDRAPIEVAKKSQEIGIQVPDRVREGDEVYKIGSKRHD